jgi:hypothetical protein
MGFHLSRAASATAVAVLLSTGPVFANAAELQENPIHSQLAHFASNLKAGGERALAAAAEATAQAVEDSKRVVTEAETDLAPHFQTLQEMLSEQKVRLATIGKDAAARFDGWKQATTETWIETWSDAWPDTWLESWAEMQRATIEALDRFRDWIEKQSVSDEQTEIPV